MPNPLFRQVAFFLSLALALPSPAFALRTLEVHEAGLEELDRSLRSSPLGQSAPFAAGAEEAVISRRAEQAVRELFGSGYSVREYHEQREDRPGVLVTVWKGDRLLGGFRLETGAGGKDLWATDVHPRLPEGRGFGRALFGFVLTAGNRWKGREVHLGGASLGRLPGAFDGLVREWGFEFLSGRWLGGEDAESFYQGSYRIPALSETQSAHLRAVAGTAWTQHSVADFARLEEAVRPALTGDGLPELPDRLRKAETLLRAGAEEGISEGVSGGRWATREDAFHGDASDSGQKQKEALLNRTPTTPSVESTTSQEPPFSGANPMADMTQPTIATTKPALSPGGNFPKKFPANPPANMIFARSASVLENTARRPSVNTDLALISSLLYPPAVDKIRQPVFIIDKNISIINNSHSAGAEEVLQRLPVEIIHGDRLISPEPRAVAIDWEETVFTGNRFAVEIKTELYAGILSGGQPTEADVDLARRYILTHGGYTPRQAVEWAISEAKRRGVTKFRPAEKYIDEENKRKDRVKEQLKPQWQADPASVLIPGAPELIQRLSAKPPVGAGLPLYIVTGGRKQSKEEESSLLGLRPFFKAIYGAAPEDPEYNKEKALRSILAEEGIRADQLVVIGDGIGEIKAGRKVGAITAGLAFNETSRKGLVKAGADIILNGGNFKAIDAFLQALKISAAGAEEIHAKDVKILIVGPSGDFIRKARMVVEEELHAAGFLKQIDMNSQVSSIDTSMGFDSVGSLKAHEATLGPLRDKVREVKPDFVLTAYDLTWQGGGAPDVAEVVRENKSSAVTVVISLPVADPDGVKAAQLQSRLGYFILAATPEEIRETVKQHLISRLSAAGAEEKGVVPSGRDARAVVFDGPDKSIVPQQPKTGQTPRIPARLPSQASLRLKPPDDHDGRYIEQKTDHKNLRPERSADESSYHQGGEDDGSRIHGQPGQIPAPFGAQSRRPAHRRPPMGTNRSITLSVLQPPDADKIGQPNYFIIDKNIRINNNNNSAGAEEEAPFSEIGSTIAAYVEFVMDVQSGVREVDIRMIGPAGKQKISFMAHEALQEDWPGRISGLLDFIGVDSAKARTWKITLEDFRKPDRGTRFFQVTLKPVSAGAEEMREGISGGRGVPGGGFSNPGNPARLIQQSESRSPRIHTIDRIPSDPLLRFPAEPKGNSQDNRVHPHSDREDSHSERGMPDEWTQDQAAQDDRSGVSQKPDRRSFLPGGQLNPIQVYQEALLSSNKPARRVFTISKKNSVINNNPSTGAEEIPAQRIAEAIERFWVEPDPAAVARNVGYYLEREGALAFAPVLALLEVEGRLSPYGFAGVVETVQEKERLLKAVGNDPDAAGLISERIFVVEAQAGRLEDKPAVARARAMGLLEGTVAQVISHPDPDLLAQLNRILSSFGYRLPEDPTVQEAALTLLQAA